MSYQEIVAGIIEKLELNDISACHETTSEAEVYFAETGKEKIVRFVNKSEKGKVRIRNVDKQVLCLFAIDGCLIKEGPKRCDAILFTGPHNSRMVYFIELKLGVGRNNIENEIKDALDQLKATRPRMPQWPHPHEFLIVLQKTVISAASQKRRQELLKKHNCNLVEELSIE